MIHVKDNKCDYCGTCVAVCPVDAIELLEADIRIDPDTCTECDLCVWVCPIDVLEAVETEETNHA